MIILIFWLIFGTIAAVIAHSKGRSAVGWFFIGALFGLFGILVIACLSNKKEEADFRNQVAQENRRLREKLDQERMKSEAFRQHVAGRLDSHDAQLGVDTRTYQAALPAPDDDPLSLFATSDSLSLLPVETADNSMPAPAPAHIPIPKPAPSIRQWFFERNGASHGPVAESELLGMLQSGTLDGATLVWTEALSDWVAASRVKFLQPHIQSNPA